MLIRVVCGHFWSNMIPLCVCNGYLRIGHMHVLGWSTMSSHSGVCLLNDIRWVYNISLATSMDFVRILPLEFCMQSSELSVVG